MFSLGYSFSKHSSLSILRITELHQRKLLYFVLVWRLFIDQITSTARLADFFRERSGRIRRFRLLLLSYHTHVVFLCRLTLTLLRGFVALHRRHFVQRTVWVKARTETWWTNVVCRNWSEREWKANFCMSKTTFTRLCADFHSRFLVATHSIS